MFDGIDVSSHLDYRLVFPANEENRRKLSELHNTGFKSYGPAEVIKSMLNDGHKCVVCYVGNYFENENDLIRKAEFDLVTKVEITDVVDIFYTPTSNWGRAIPMDSKTGKIIVGYLGGEMIFRD